MIVEVYKCPQCGKESRIANLDGSHTKKILLLCLECRDAPVMIFQHMRLIDADGYSSAVMV